MAELWSYRVCHTRSYGVIDAEPIWPPLVRNVLKTCKHYLTFSITLFTINQQSTMAPKLLTLQVDLTDSPPSSPEIVCTGRTPALVAPLILPEPEIQYMGTNAPPPQVLQPTSCESPSPAPEPAGPSTPLVSAPGTSTTTAISVQRRPRAPPLPRPLTYAQHIKQVRDKIKKRAQRAREAKASASSSQDKQQ